MKVKLKKVVCLLCSIVVMATAFIVPMTASAVSEPLYNFWNGDELVDYSDFQELIFEDYEVSIPIDIIKSSINNYLGYDIEDYYYITCLMNSERNWISVGFKLYPKDDLTNDTLNITSLDKSSQLIYSDEEKCIASYLGNCIIKNNFAFSRTNLDGYISLLPDIDKRYIGMYTNIPNVSYNDEIVKEEEKPLVPFTVTYSPELSDDMKNVVYIPSKGGANGDENVLVEQQKDSFELTVTLTDEYIELLNKYPDLNKITYEFIVYITTEPPESVGYSQSANKAVYTDVHYGYYMYTTSGVVADVTDDYNESTNWIKAQGANIGYIIPKGQKSKTVSIRLENIDTSQLSENQHLYCVVYGRQTLLDYPTPDYFNVANQQSLCKGELNSTITYVIEDDDNDPDNNIEVVAPDYYCATSDPFYFSEYPEYTSKRLENGEIFDTNKGVFAYTDKKITPDKMWDFEMASNGDKGLSPDDFKVYEDKVV